jgi:hypothetical protein
MKLDKKYLTKLILESFQEQQSDGGKRISPIGQSVDTNQVMKQNISQHLRILKFMQETLKQINTPTELQNMISQIQKSKTVDFLKQVLNVDETIPIKVSSILENPLELLQAIMGEIIKVATEKGNKKITEGNMLETNTIEEKDIKYYIREPEARLEKHKKKIKTLPPPPVLEEDQIAEGFFPVKSEIEKLEKKGKKYQELASKRWDQGREQASQIAMNMAHQYFDKANELRAQQKSHPYW